MQAAKKAIRVFVEDLEKYRMQQSINNNATSKEKQRTLIVIPPNYITMPGISRKKTGCQEENRISWVNGDILDSAFYKSNNYPTKSKSSKNENPPKRCPLTANLSHTRTESGAFV